MIDGKNCWRKITNKMVGKLSRENREKVRVI